MPVAEEDEEDSCGVKGGGGWDYSDQAIGRDEDDGGRHLAKASVCSE